MQQLVSSKGFLFFCFASAKLSNTNLIQSRPPAVERLAASAKSKVVVDAEVFLFHAR
ncbi:unnamed protein product, partial [Ixodes persulcatus]